MGKDTYSQSGWDLTTSVGFKAAFAPLSASLQACGLVKTSDTGQIDLVGGTFTPVVSTIAGYEIYRFNDPLQATAPIYLKLEYGWGTATNRTGLYVTVGTGSNGAGTITGVTLVRHGLGSTATTVVGTAVPTYCCHKDGHFVMVLAWGIWGANKGAAFILIDRPVDDTGTPVADGWYGLFNAGTGLIGAHVGSAGPGQAPAANCIGCLVLQGAVSTVVGGDVQVFRHYHASPRIRPVVGVVTYVNAEFASGLGSLFTIPVVGSTPRTYLPLGLAGVIGADISGSGLNALAVLWEA